MDTEAITAAPLVQLTPPEILNIQTNYSPQIRDHFPFPTIREGQEQSLSAIERAYKSNKKFIIIEAPTGTGKSGMAIAAGSHAKTITCADEHYRRGSYLLT